MLCSVFNGIKRFLTIESNKNRKKTDHSSSLYADGHFFTNSPKIERVRGDIFINPPYSSDTASWDYHLFQSLGEKNNSFRALFSLLLFSAQEFQELSIYGTEQKYLILF